MAEATVRQQQQDAAPSPTKNTTTSVDFDESYRRHEATAARIKCKYERLYREMVDELSAAHLEPIAQALLQHKKETLLDGDNIAAVLRSQLLAQLLRPMDMSWQSDMANGIARLEMLKEKFKPYMGHNWQAPHLQPGQRLLPTRMRYKESSKRYLQKQIELQNIELEKLLKTNAKHRSRIQQVSSQRIYLTEGMEREHQKLERLRELKQQHADLLYSE